MSKSTTAPVTQTWECPSWCDPALCEQDHEGARHAQLIATVDSFQEWRDGNGHLIREECDGALTVSTVSWHWPTDDNPSGRPFIELQPPAGRATDFVDLTATEARQVAAALLQAADVLEESGQ